MIAPYLPWYHGDFMRSTRGWHIVARGTYRELLDAQWDAESLDPDPEELRQLANVPENLWAIAWKKIESKFPIDDKDGRRRNVRLAEIRVHTYAVIKAKSRGGMTSKKRNINKHLTRVLKDSTQDSGRYSDLDTDAKVGASAPTKISEPLRNLTLAPERVTVAPHAPRATAHRLPTDFELNSVRIAYAEKHQVNPTKAFENFRDYWQSASGSKARKHDWDATWRMWCRKDSENPRPGTKITPRRKTADELQAEEDQRNAIERATRV